MYHFRYVILENYMTILLHNTIDFYKEVKYCYENYNDPGKTIHQIMTIRSNDYWKTNLILVRILKEKKEKHSYWPYWMFSTVVF